MITRITRDTINEITIQPRIVAMPNYKSFFYTFHTAEPIEIGRLQDDYIESTECIKGGYILLKSYAIQQSPILSYLTCVKRLVDLYLHLLQAVKMLNEASIIHLNICFQNIIIKDGNLPLLTGLESATFFLMSPLKTIRSPIECRALRYIIGNKLASISTYTIRDICGDNKEEQTFLSKYINQPATNIIVALLKYASTWNVYSLNEMILSLLHNPIQPDTFLFKWKNLLERGIIAAADDRGTADYFIEQTKELMYSADIADLTIATTSSTALL
jgi:hypothetical protein